MYVCDLGLLFGLPVNSPRRNVAIRYGCWGEIWLALRGAQVDDKQWSRRSATGRSAVAAVGCLVAAVVVMGGGKRESGTRERVKVKMGDSGTRTRADL
jgi:hypothetical protein